MEGVSSDVTANVPEEVPQEVPEEVPGEVPDIPDIPDLQAVQASSPPRVRKVRIKEPPPQKANHVYWGDKLQEHRATQRQAKSERYGNLRIM
jgi:hypothetical protein